MKRARLMRGSKPPEHNALRSRGCPDPDRAVVVRRSRPPRSVSRSVSPSPLAAPPLAFQVENVRRQWQEAVTEVRRLRVAGEDNSAALVKARELRTLLVQLDPELAVQARRVAVDQGSATNPVKAV